MLVPLPYLHLHVLYIFNYVINVLIPPKLLKERRKGDIEWFEGEEDSTHENE